MLQRLTVLGLMLCFWCAAASSALAAAGDELPAWLQTARAVTAPDYEKKIKAVTLYDEAVVNVGADGKTSTTHSYAVRVLQREGRGEAIAKQFYLSSSSKVRDIRGWLIRADGSIKTYGKDNIVDLIADPDDIYNEYRMRIIDASGDADAGSVFGYQVTVEETPLFNQDVWFFQTDLPVLQSRYTLNLPAGWQAQGVAFNRAGIEPRVSGTSYTWELKNLLPIVAEPQSPSVPNLAPRIAVSYQSSGSAASRSFKDWTEVSRWSSELNDPSVVIDDAIATKARDLTANAKTEFDKIRAIGSFVQNLQYISVDIGVGKGNGYRPRPSTLVLQRGYGDCKDKANLMRALLKTLKIEAYPVAVHSGDPTFVREEWASPTQFNHAILAVKVADETNAPTIVTHPTLGRLLIFDATDAFTPVGDLPDYLQNSFALVAAGDHGKLMRMPVTPPESNKLERTATIELDASGSVKGTIHENSFGQAAALERRFLRSLPANDYKRTIESWITRGISTAVVGKVAPTDRNSDGRFELDVEFTAPAYAQLMQGRLLVFKPALVSRLNSLWLTEANRTHPVILDSNAFTETAVFKLPAGFAVDETPDPLQLETAFGKYSTSYDVKEGHLTFVRKLVLNSATVPVEKYAEVQKFFVQIRAAEQNPVVLIKK